MSNWCTLATMDPKTLTFTLSANRGRFGIRLEGHTQLDTCWGNTGLEAYEAMGRQLTALTPAARDTIFGGLHASGAGAGAPGAA
jgi:hypothetical protein